MQKRVLSIILDYIIILVLSSPFYYIFLKINGSVESAGNYYMYIVMIILVIKDLIFRNASIAKKIMKLEVRKEDGSIPSMLTLILRNLTFIIWPIEILLILLKKDRIGDKIFHTKVVEKIQS